MHYILYVQLDHFYLRSFSPEAREPLSKPILVIRDKVVIDANTAAAMKSIRVGMSQDHARALAPQAEIQPWRPEAYITHQEAWLDICAQYSGVIEPEEQHSAYIDLSLHPAPINVALQLTDKLATEGYKVQAGIASSKWVAKLACKEERLTATDSEEFLRDLPVDSLAPIDPGHLERLKFFGYRTIGEVANIQLATLKRQFDHDAIKIRLAARGRFQDPVKALYPRDCFIDSLMFDSQVDSLEEFDLALKAIAQRLGKRLREQDLFGADIQTEIEFEDETKTFARRFAKPVKCPQSMLGALRLLLEGQLAQPISAIRIRLPKLERTRSVQADLLGKSEKDKSIDFALHNLRAAFGEKAVQSGREIQLPRRLRVLKEWKDALGWQ